MTNNPLRGRIAPPLFDIRRRLAGHGFALHAPGRWVRPPVRASSLLWTGPPLDATLTFVSLAGPGLLLVAGLWTPLAGMAVAAIELSQILTSEDVVVPLMAATMGAALAMLGPGRWSLDARLFGWKRIEAPPRAQTPNAH